MPEIIPAVLPKDFDELAARLASLRGIARLVQIDIVDGIFAPAMTWPYRDGTRFERILAEEEGMPSWEDFSFEIDLMVSESRRDTEQWIRAGASRIIVHAESRDAAHALSYAQDFRPGKAAFSVETGIALSLTTELRELDRFADLYDFIQLMGISHIGMQGEALDERIYARVRELREQYAGTISIDGGVKLENARKLTQAGATRLVAGSAILSAEDPREAYKAILREANA